MNPTVTAPWLYNVRLRAVAHDSRHCDTCRPWLAHLAQDLAAINPTLTEAEYQRDTDIRDRTDTENADLRSALTDARVALCSVRNELDGALDSLRTANDDKSDLRSDLAEARESIRRLETELNARGSTPRRHKQARRLDSPPTHTPSRPASAMTGPTASTLPSDSLVSRVAGPLSARIGKPNPPTTFAPSPFLRSVGFYALLPVIVQRPGMPLWAVDDSAPLAADGDIDFSVHERYVFAFGRWYDDEPAWTTTLVYRDFFLTPDAVAARASHLSLPIRDVVIGGRNGSLISTSGDPTTESEMETLLGNPGRVGRANGFIDRVRFTPPELRCDFHNRALERWAATTQERTREARSRARRFEPPPSAPVDIWRTWLKHMYENATEKGKPFTYCGIPRIENDYQDAHIEGAKAIIAFVPLTPKGFAVRGQIRDPFLRAAATVICEPEGYTRIITQMDSIIASTKSNTRYDEAMFGRLANITPQAFARYAATIGVTATEAESWRSWAAAYIAMEIEERPHSKYAADLTRARDAAHAIIDNNSKWVISNVHPDSPGYYNPASDRSQTEPLASTTQLPEDTFEMDAVSEDVHLYDMDEDSEAMGPAL
ncbi:hypothetical protein BC826DRAFT_1111367 [Russula brevipes]|nr:hypothetical protein BC826DRAFT_1111367 [Russula brevipes]